MPLSVIKPLTVLTGSLKDEDCLKSTLIIRFEIMKHYFLSVQLFHASKMIMILNNYLSLLPDDAVCYFNIFNFAVCDEFFEGRKHKN